MKQVHVFISGVVQGVGFRFFVKANARDLHVTGWVRNTTNGLVEAVFQGEKNSLEQMIALCHKGPFLSEVKTVEVTWEESKEVLPEFNIR
jgi:acylphosphatase